MQPGSLEKHSCQESGIRRLLKRNQVSTKKDYNRDQGCKQQGETFAQSGLYICLCWLHLYHFVAWICHFRQPEHQLSNCSWTELQYPDILSICLRTRINPSLALPCCKKCCPKKLHTVVCMVSAILSDDTPKTPLCVMSCLILSKNLTYNTKCKYIWWRYSFSCVFETVNNAYISGGVIPEVD